MTGPSGSEFDAFVADVEARLRIALTALLGPEDGRDAAAAALAYAWEEWDRVSQMANPAGYLYEASISKGTISSSVSGPALSFMRRRP